MKELETLAEIKEKLNHTGQLNASETWQIVNLIEIYEKGIEELNRKMIEVEKRYSPHLHGYQMEILWKAEALHYKYALKLFSLNVA